MSQTGRLVFETERLSVRTATEADVDLFYALWTNPAVMKHVGFPQGLPITREELMDKPFPKAESEFDQRLVVVLKDTGEPIGECKLGRPDESGVVEPDIKLLPPYWGHKYGREVWMALVAYLFEHSTCDAIMTTPNVDNIAALKTYEATGAVREGEDVYHFPEPMQAYTTPVHHYIYKLYRSDWEAATDVA